MSGLKDARTRRAYRIFSGPAAHLLSVLRVWMKILSDASAKKKEKKKRLKGFYSILFYSIFLLSVLRC